MKWITHTVAAAGAAYALGMPVTGLAGVVAGSVLPDVLDQTLARLLIFRNLAFSRIHRGTTHWFGWWLALLFAGLLQAHAPAAAPGLAADATVLALGVGFGALMHVLLDMCTVTGVPLAPWSRKIMLSFKLCRTGSLREYAFLVLVLAIFALYARQDLLRLVAEARRHMR